MKDVIENIWINTALIRALPRVTEEAANDPLYKIRFKYGDIIQDMDTLDLKIYDGEKWHLFLSKRSLNTLIADFGTMRRE